jgi:hypothetical protein
MQKDFFFFEKIINEFQPSPKRKKMKFLSRRRRAKHRLTPLSMVAAHRLLHTLFFSRSSTVVMISNCYDDPNGKNGKKY